MGFVIQDEIQYQYRDIWHIHLAKSFENDESISLCIAESKIDLERHICNITLEIRYKSEVIEVCGCEHNAEYVLLIRPKSSRSRQDYFALENVIIANINPMLLRNTNNESIIICPCLSAVRSPENGESEAQTGEK